MINITQNLPEIIILGGLSIHIYGIITSLSLLLVYIFSRSKLEENSYEDGQIDLLLIASLFFGLVWGRLAYLLLNPEVLLAAKPGLTGTLRIILEIWTGGIHLYGVFVGVLLAILLVARKIKKSAEEITDTIVVYLPLAQAIGRIGNLINKELFGPPTDKPWGIFIPESRRPEQYIGAQYFHPTFLYESLLNIINLVVMFRLAKQFNKKTSEASPQQIKQRQGILTLVYFLNYSVIRFIVEFWRLDTSPVLLGLKPIQLASISVGFITSLLLIQKYSQGKTEEVFVR